MEKAALTVNGERLEFGIPISKVNKEERTVSGFATLDNEDREGDVVSADASAKAFKRWRGNVREMHQPLAVGKAVDFKETEFFDKQDGKTYRGVFVTVYVSKGAESTWEKVLDNTLTGFSIGGKVLEKSDPISKDDGRTYRIIKDYDLVELSLVDSPCNTLANIMSISKSDEGMLVKGMATDVRTQNVFYCNKDGSAVLTADDNATCVECDSDLTNIGWVEDTEGKSGVVKSLIAKHESDKQDTGFTISAGDGVYSTNHTGTNGNYTIHLNLPGQTNNPVVVQEKTLGGVDVATKTEEVTETPVEEPVAEETPAEPEVEKAAPVAEVEPNEEAAPDLNELFSKFTTQIIDSVEASKAATEEVVKSAKEEFTESVGAVKENVDGLAEKFDSLAARVKSIEDSGAIKKSAEVVEKASEATEEKSFWSGSFLAADDLVS